MEAQITYGTIRETCFGSVDVGSGIERSSSIADVGGKRIHTTTTCKLILCRIYPTIWPHARSFCPQTQSDRCLAF